MVESQVKLNIPAKNQPSGSTIQIVEPVFESKDNITLLKNSKYESVDQT
jgi:hypothetical protein